MDGPDGTRIKIERQEFPWDITIWTNICQGMGSKNPLAWFWPLATSPAMKDGLAFEHNGIDRMSTALSGKAVADVQQIRASPGHRQTRTA